MVADEKIKKTEKRFSPDHSNDMARIKLLLSFDHELSLGGTDCYHTNLFGPTYKILELANKIDVPITLFTDILCAKRFREWDGEGFFMPYYEQIATALKSNHDVQLHIHPHWVDTNFTRGRFIPSKNYKLSDFTNHQWPDNIPGIIGQGTDFLREICCNHKTDYLCIAFRAGGYNLAPETELILSSLYENGIRIESSVTKGFYFKSGISEINFRNMPKSANWFISIKGPLNQEGESGLYEIPIAGMPRGIINNVPFLMKRVLFKKRDYKSIGRGIHEGHTSLIQKLRRLFPRSAWTLSFDGYTESVHSLMKIIGYYVNAHQEDNTIICSAISHPKSMGDYSLGLMEGFILALRKEYGDRIEFCTYRQIYDEINIEQAL